MELKEALGNLDTMEDGHWTSDGSPRLDVLKDFLGKSVTRQEVLDAAPQFNRSNPVLKQEEQSDAQGEEVRQEEEVNNIEEYLDGEPLAPAEFNQFIQRVTDGELPVLEEALEQQLMQAELARKAADELYQIVKYSLSITRVVKKNRIPDVDNQTAIRQYIESQSQNRLGRAVKTAEIRQVIGNDLKNLDPRAPIDRAMARKTARGGNRPNWRV